MEQASLLPSRHLPGGRKGKGCPNSADRVPGFSSPLLSPSAGLGKCRPGNPLILTMRWKPRTNTALFSPASSTDKPTDLPRQSWPIYVRPNPLSGLLVYLSSEGCLILAEQEEGGPEMKSWEGVLELQCSQCWSVTAEGGAGGSLPSPLNPCSCVGPLGAGLEIPLEAEGAAKTPCLLSWLHREGKPWGLPY